MLSKSNYRLIIFDLDDTLVHSNINFNAIKTELMNLLGKSPNNKPLKHISINELLEEIKIKTPKSISQATNIIAFHELNAAKLAEPVPFADLIPKLLKKHNILSAILTNNSKSIIEQYLNTPELNYLKGYDLIFSRDEVPKMKPNPDGLLAIMSKFKAKQNETLFIGDSKLDCDAANAAGVRFILYNKNSIDLKTFGCIVWRSISNLSELQAIL